MEQFYFLAVLLNILIGFILFYKDKTLSCGDTLEQDDEVSFLEEKHGTFEDLFSEKSFLTSSKVQFVLGCSGIIVSVMLLLSPFSGIFLFGDLIPAIVCLAASVSMLINSYFEDSITDLKLNETSVVEATVMIARMIAVFLNELSAYCYIDYYHTPTSNHSQNRNLGSKASELALEDMEYVIGNYIHDMLINNNRVNVHLNNGYDYIEIPIFNFNILAMHGHTIKNLDTALKDLSATHRKLIDYIFVGHWHNGKVIPGNEHEHHDTEVLMCPSFQGTDPYAFNKLGLSSKAACKMFIFDRKYGCTGTEKFILN